MRARRLVWADGAKGISIVLLVIWHACSTRLPFNEALILLRMPLFFLVSGMFSARVVNADWATLLRERIAVYMYIFVVWSIIVFMSTVYLLSAFRGSTPDMTPMFRIFIDPPLTLWFIYALAIAIALTKLIARLPRYLVLIIAIGLYTWSVSSGEWLKVSFIERIIRLMPFFLIGYYFRTNIEEIVSKLSGRWAIFLVISVVCILIVYYSDLRMIGPIVFATSLLSIISVFLITNRWSEAGGARVLALLGGASLYIYVIHKIPLFYVTLLAKTYEVNTLPLMFAASLLIVAFCVVVGRSLEQLGMRWLFRPPWMTQPRQQQGQLLERGPP